jgi:hypothetical protein
MTSALTAKDFDDLHDFIKVQVAAGYIPVADIVEEAVDAFADASVEPTALRGAARAVAELTVRSHLEAQQGWPARTDCDRLDTAFAALEESGILARQHFSCCGTCGAQEIRDELDQAEKEGQPARGYTFFHMQDTEQAIAGESLYLSYGAAGKDDAAAVAIGHEIVRMLTTHGFAPWWNGKLAHRIELPLEWRRRRPSPAA